MALIASGDQNSTPPAPEPGTAYTFTVSVPLELPDWATGAVTAAVSAVLSAAASIRIIGGVSNVSTREPGNGWTDVVVEFST